MREASPSPQKAREIAPLEPTLARRPGKWQNSRVRFLLLILLTALTGAALPAFAQQQEKTMEERILSKPDPKKIFDLQQSAFGSGRSYGTSKARTSNFQYEDKVRTKNYSTRGFYGAKSSWQGDIKFSTAQANTKGKYEIPNATKQADTKTMPTKEAYDANKTVAVNSLSDGKRPYLGQEAERIHKGINPNQPNVGWRGDLKEMTIDDVREILNKNK